ncbi:MAG: right-handed parallel beta-helix repeat-containing protein [Myxococcota bacterium]
MWWTSAALGADVCPSGCPFPDIEAAMSTVDPGGSGTFTVSAGSWSHDHTLGVQEGRQIRFEAEGAATLTNTGVGPVFYVTGDGSKLTLVDFSLTGFNDRALRVDFKGEIELVRAVVFTIGLQDEGGAILADNATLDVQDSLFLDNVATGDGGQILARNSTVSVTDCRFSGGFAGRGGAIAFVNGVDLPTTLWVENTTFEDNLASDMGGAVFVQGSVEVTITGSTFRGNASEQDGGALADDVPTTGPSAVSLTLDEVVFEENSADGSGGAVRLRSAADLLATDNVFRDNLAAAGGALWLADGVLHAYRNQWCENRANSGGAISTLTSQAQVWFNERFIANTAGIQGGAIDHGGGALSLVHSDLLANDANFGSAVQSDDAVHLESSLVGWNEGATAVTATDITVTHDLFWSNAVGDLKRTDGPIADNGTNLFGTDPLLERFDPADGCDSVVDYRNYYGPLVDAGEPNGVDLDLSPPDIGAYGGAQAPAGPWTDDADGDQSPRLFDCAEGDPVVFPGASDAAYDGLDTNCDLSDDFDRDGDGWDGPTVDCDDRDPLVSPGGEDTLTTDGNCDGVVDYDGDDSPAELDCDDTDPEVYPGATEDPGKKNLDCAGPADVLRAMEPMTCASGGPVTFGWLGGAGLLSAYVRRLRSGR